MLKRTPIFCGCSVLPFVSCITDGALALQVVYQHDGGTQVFRMPSLFGHWPSVSFKTWIYPSSFLAKERGRGQFTSICSVLGSLGTVVVIWILRKTNNFLPYVA